MGQMVDITHVSIREEKFKKVHISQIKNYYVMIKTHVFFHLPQMAKQWKEIALILRDRQVEENEDHETDIFDVQVTSFITETEQIR